MTGCSWTERIPTLQGQLVDVREVELGDATTLFELLSEPDVVTHISPPPPSVETMAGFILWSQQQRALGKSVCFGIVPRGLGSAVGIIQVRPLVPSWFTAEWGFALGRSFWSTGVFTDAANVVVDFAFRILGVDRLEARAVSENERGHAALQKLGAVAEGTLAKGFRHRGRTANQLLWSLRREDWQARCPNRERLCAKEAVSRIADAVRETQQMFEANRPQARPPVSYPFFLTDPDE